MMKTLTAFLFLMLLCSRSQAQPVKSYQGTLTIDAARKRIAADLSVTLAVDADTLKFLLHRRATVASIQIGEASVPFTFDTAGVAPNRFLPDGRQLYILTRGTAKGLHTLRFQYECALSELKSNGASFTDDWIELNRYGTWFPTNDGYGNFTYSLNIRIADGYSVSGAGTLGKTADGWQLVQNNAGSDIVVLASNKMKTKILQPGGSTIRVDYFNLPDAKADSLLNDFQEIYQFLQTCFGNTGGTAITFSINPARGITSYSRKGFVSLQIAGQNAYRTGKGISHEIGHFWWRLAPSDSWEDWLNESFAEYSTLLFIRHKYGQEKFDNEVAEYRSVSATLPALWGMDRSNSNASSTLYRKGPVILHDLEKKVGREKFLAFLQGILSQKISTTAKLLQLTEERLSPDIKIWLESALKN